MPYATGSGVRIHYEVEGSGPPLVLHTGFVGSLLDWYYAGYVDALKAENTLVLLDPRGQGDSEKPHEPGAYGPAQRVADVLAVLDALGIGRADFLGYSMGGRVGYDLGAQAPERFFSLMIGGNHPFGNPPNPASAERLRKGMEAVMDEVNRAEGPLPAELRAQRLASDAEALAAVTLVERPNLEVALEAMRLPILVYCAERDPAFERAQRAAALLPNAIFVSLPGLNHREGLFKGAASLPHITAFLQRVRSGAGVWEQAPKG
jgi:pimeloyl-ACP methyl ester carboxylesterase